MLSDALLDLPVKLRAVSAEECFHDLLKNGAGEIRFLDHLDILFDQSLQLDAISLIKNSSRRFTLVASWPGVHEGDMLSYGSPDHPSFVQFTPVKDEQTLHVIQ
jgi:ATP-dependent helicase/nuclease subunit A